eukprot:CAMPEP_0195521784 /NCGR_PEP_ID=MMETSP0794_2-20130614/19333_1 /TAXON_ID=515487 /ORGANISM="Stephanopyxis turris, Strain CCMP 815" /LENGTH=581 /DNA_ID=CAMNT_0040651403 /DNA_START=113 /DNA_END=1858 /DNA_ORIENTATION=-
MANDGAEVSYSFQDESGLMQYMNQDNKKKQKKKKKKKGGAIGGYSSATEGDVTDNDRAKAQSLASNPQLLKQKLQDKLFVDACFLRGVEPNQLKPRSFESFATEPNRAKRLSPEEQKLRYDNFEGNRLNLLALVVSQEGKSRQKAKETEARNANRFNKLSSTFQKQLEREQAILARMNKSRSKYERVLETENVEITHTLKKSEVKSKTYKHRHSKIKDMKKKIQEQLRERSKIRKTQIEQRVEARKQEEENWRQMQRMKLEAKEKQIKRFQEGQAGNKDDVKSKQARQRALRQERTEQAKVQAKLKREHLARKMAEKEAKAAAVRAERMAQRNQGKVEKRLKSQARAAKADRVRKAKVYERQRLIDRMEGNYARMAAMKEMKEAIDEKRRDLLRLEKIRRDEWRAATAVERSITPGPGAYELKSTLADSGGTWGKFKPKTELDWIEYRAAQVPAPGDYHSDKFSTLNKNGGSWSKYKPKTDVEWRMEKAAQEPGPGEYKVLLPASTTTATFGNFTPKSELDLVILRAKESPAPGEHQPSQVPKPRRKLEQLAATFAVSNKAVMFAAKLKKKMKQRAQSAKV